MFYWIPYAFVRISVFFIAGIIFGIFLPTLIPVYVAGGIFIALTISYFSIVLYNQQKKKLVWNPGLIGLLAVLFAGYCNVWFETETNRPTHIANIGKPIQYYQAVALYAQEKNSLWKNVAQVQRTYDGKNWSESSGNVLLYLPKKDFLKSLSYGDVILVKGAPQRVTAPANPGEFDYRRYLANKNIYHQQFINTTDILNIDHEPPSIFMSIALGLRTWADLKLKSVVEGKQEQAIASALVLGITDGLDNELMGAYAATGAMHVLSVSGLHVGILYLMMMLLLKPLLKIRHGKWVVAAISLLILWIYACVTGLSPSVLRAVTMFSFMVVAKPLDQRTNIYNILTASAFILLLFDPFLILSVGFQLSYLAVIGIVYLQPLLYNMLEPRSRILDEIWKVTAVSIAAQIATFAIGLFYFHQFPNYFLISNLYVLPLGFGILVGGLAVLFFSFLAPVAALLGMILEWMIKLLNYLIVSTESWPYSVISNIQISFFQCVVLMTLTVMALLFFQHRKTIFLYLASLAVVCFGVSSWMTIPTNFAPARITIYKVPGESVIDLIENGNAFSFSDADPGKISYHVKPNRTLHHVELVSDGTTQIFSRSCSIGQISSWNGKALLQLTSTPAEDMLPLEVDYLVISSNSIRRWSQIPKSLSAKCIIIDSSNSFRSADQLWKTKNENTSVIYSVWHLGAFDKTI